MIGACVMGGTNCFLTKRHLAKKCHQTVASLDLPFFSQRQISQQENGQSNCVASVIAILRWRQQTI